MVSRLTGHPPCSVPSLPGEKSALQSSSDVTLQPRPATLPWHTQACDLPGRAPGAFGHFQGSDPKAQGQHGQVASGWGGGPSRSTSPALLCSRLCPNQLPLFDPPCPLSYPSIQLKTSAVGARRICRKKPNQRPILCNSKKQVWNKAGFCGPYANGLLPGGSAARSCLAPGRHLSSGFLLCPSLGHAASALGIGLGACWLSS